MIDDYLRSIDEGWRFILSDYEPITNDAIQLEMKFNESDVKQ